VILDEDVNPGSPGEDVIIMLKGGNAVVNRASELPEKLKL
jgi:hypothetical protein